MLLSMGDCLWMYEVWLLEVQLISTQDEAVCIISSSAIRITLAHAHLEQGDLKSFLKRSSSTDDYIKQEPPQKLVKYQNKVGLFSHNGRLVLMKPTFYSSSYEFTFLKKCKHPHINTLLDVLHKTEKSFYLVLEYHPHGNLEQYVRIQKRNNSVIPAEIMSQWMKQLLEAVAHMHKLNVIHCDIKSQNILVMDPCRLCIADLGEAQQPKDDSKCEFLRGTPAYDAPELEHSNNSRESDMWCLGCVFLEAMTLVVCTDIGGFADTWVKENIHVTNLDKTKDVYPFWMREMVCNCMQLAPHMRPSAKDLLLTLA